MKINFFATILLTFAVSQAHGVDHQKIIESPFITWDKFIEHQNSLPIDCIEEVEITHDEFIKDYIFSIMNKFLSDLYKKTPDSFSYLKTLRNTTYDHVVTNLKKCIDDYKGNTKFSEEDTYESLDSYFNGFFDQTVDFLLL